MLESTQPIEGADYLQSAVVDGLPIVVSKNYTEGEKVVYFPMGLELPPYVARIFGVEQHLRKGRVIKTVKLKGYVSYGMALRLDGENADPFFGGLSDLPVGTDVDFFFGTKKYEPPVSPIAGRFGVAAVNDPRMPRFTDIQRLNSKEKYLEGKEVYVTEKIDGSSVRIGYFDGELVVGSRNLTRAEPTYEEKKTNWFWYPTLDERVMSLLRVLHEEQRYKHIILYGEVYGSGVNPKMHYDVKGLNFMAYDLVLDGKYVDAATLISLFTRHHIPAVPVDYLGPFDAGQIKALAQRKSNLTHSNIKEGIVVRTLHEEYHPREGRLIYKHLNPEYDIRKSAGKVDDITDN